MSKENKEYLYGYNPIYLALAKNAGSRGLYRLFLNKKKKKSQRLDKIISLAKKREVEIRELEKKDFKSYFQKDFSILDGFSNQGMVLEASPYNYYNLDKYLGEGLKKDSRLVILDGVTDVGNFGSIIRNCSAFSFDGIIITKNRSVSVNKRVSKISAGALENVKVFRVTNLVRNIEKLKEAGFWIYGTGMDSRSNAIDSIEFVLPMALIFGNEEKGISRLVEKKCDYMVKVKMSENIQSLNVSVASGIIMHQVYKGGQNE